MDEVKNESNTRPQDLSGIYPAIPFHIKKRRTSYLPIGRYRSAPLVPKGLSSAYNS